MLVPLLLAASLAAPLAVPLAATPSSTATVLANRTAFNQPCVNFTSTAPDRLAAQASGATSEAASATSPARKRCMRRSFGGAGAGVSRR